MSYVPCGPWSVYFEPDERSVKVIDNSYGDAFFAAYCGPLSVASVNYEAYYPRVEIPLAHARLMAAAPELLQACQAVLDLFSLVPGSFPETRELLAAVIAKATQAGDTEQ